MLSHWHKLLGKKKKKRVSISERTASELTTMTEPHRQFKGAASQSNTETTESQLVQRLHSPEQWTRIK